MENKRRNRKGRRDSSGGFFTKLLAHTGGNPADIEDQDWYLDSPDVRLTRIFSVVLVLHIIAVGGILAFKMIDKAAGPNSAALAKAQVVPKPSIPAQTEFSGKVAEASSTPLVPAIPNSRDDRYCVIPGDTLSEIASKLGVSVQDLKLTNHIASPDEIIPGMWLKIPVPVVLNPTDASDYEGLPDHPVEISEGGSHDQMKQDKQSSSSVVYEVQKGDTAWRISQKFGVKPNDILRYNGVPRPELLQVGQLLKIPTP